MEKSERREQLEKIAASGLGNYLQSDPGESRNLDDMIGQVDARTGLNFYQAQYHSVLYSPLAGFGKFAELELGAYNKAREIGDE